MSKELTIIIQGQNEHALDQFRKICNIENSIDY